MPLFAKYNKENHCIGFSIQAHIKKQLVDGGLHHFNSTTQTHIERRNLGN
jgi:hypothetical protein